jgi:hypothetical protein
MKLRIVRKTPASPAERLAFAGCVSAREDDRTSCSSIREAQIDQMIANAKSLADHEAIVAACQQESERNKEHAATHLKFAQSYDHRPRWKFGYSKICRDMAERYVGFAKEDADLAEEHCGMAEKMQAGTEPSGP